MNEHSMYMSEWMEHGEETPVVMSSRIRLARNLDNHVHPLMFTSDIEGQKVINEVQDALPQMQALQLSDMEQRDKLKLVAKHLISSELIKQPASAVLLNEDESLSIMVNEEDHIRIQAMSTDMNLASLFQKASEVDDELDRKLSISFDETLGYLTTCPTNIGTGMRASVMLHLPGLSITKRMNRIAQTINRFGFTIRGIYGEGSQVYGHVFQVSNQLTLGRTEEQIIETLIEIVQQIITEELNVRKQLHQHSSVEMEDRIYRSLGLLRYGRLMPLEEAAMRLSEVKLGVDLGYIELSDFKFNEMMVAIQSPFLINETDEISINEQRANVIREHIN